MSFVLYHGGAAWVGGAQLDARLSLGGKVSGSGVVVRSPRVINGLRGVRVVGLGPGCGVGLGTLRAVDGDSLEWTGPGDVAGAVTAVPGNGRARIPGGDEFGGWIEVERLDALPLGGSAVVQCCDVFNNALAGRDFTSDEEAAGETQYGAVYIKNESGATWSAVKAWVSTTADSGLEVALEAVVDGEAQLPADEVTAPTGVTWTALFNEAGAVEVTSVPNGGYVCLRWKRVLAAESGAKARGRNAVVVKLGTAEVTLTGLYRVPVPGAMVVLLKEGERPTIEDVVWAGPAGAWNVADANLTEGTWYVHAQEVSAYGIAGPVTEVVLTVNAEGEVITNPPVAPESVGVVSVSGGGVVVNATYDPYAEGRDGSDVDAKRGDTWEVRVTGDGTDPREATSVDYVPMVAATGDAPEFLTWESVATYLDGAPVRAAVRVLRDNGWRSWEAELDIDGAQMDPPNASPYTGTAAWSFDNYGTVRLIVLYTVPNPNIGEVALYEGAPGDTGTYVRRLALSIPGGFQMTFTREELEEYTATPHYIVVENTAGDDIRCDLVLPAWTDANAGVSEWLEATCTHQVTGVRRVKAWAHAGSEGLYFAPVTGESDDETIDAGKGIVLTWEPGSLALEANGVLCLRLVWRGAGHEANGVYIPNEFEVNVGAYSGGSAGSNDVIGFGTWDGSNKELVLRARGENLGRWDVQTMVVTLCSIGVGVTAGGMPGGSYGGEQGAYARWAESLLSVFDPEDEGARAMLRLVADSGLVGIRGKLELGMNAAAVAAV